MEQQSESDWNAFSPLEKARSLADSAAQAQKQGQDQVAYAHYVQALNLYRGLGDRVNIVRMLIRINYLAGWADFHDGLDMFTRKRVLADEALPLAREINAPKLLAVALCAFSSSVPANNPMAMLEESLAIAQTIGDRQTQAMVLSSIANHCALQGDHKRAEVV